MLLSLNHARIQKYCQKKSNKTLTHFLLGIKIPLKADHHQPNSKTLAGR